MKKEWTPPKVRVLVAGAAERAEETFSLLRPAYLSSQDRRG
jgi:hypothetical protein